MTEKEKATEKARKREQAHDFARWLKNYREVERSLGLNQFAERVGLSNATISKIESGEHIPAPYSIRRIAEWGKLDADWLMALAGHRALPPGDAPTLDDPEMMVLLSPSNLNKMTPRERKMVKDLVRNILEGKE